MKTITRNNLRKDANHLADDFQDLAHHAGQLAADSARLAKQNLVKPGVQFSRDATDRIRSATSRGLNRAETEFDRCVSVARHNPVLTAVAIGIAGIVLGLAVGAKACESSPDSQSGKDPVDPDA